MSRSPLLAPALLLLALPAQAAPLPARDTPPFDKYLPDDTDFVLVLNARQVLAKPMFTRHYRELVREALGHPEVQTWLKGTDLDPLEDIEHIVMCTGKSCFPDDPEEFRKGTGPLVLVQGKFDAAKLHARLAALAKEGPDKVQIHDGDRGKIYESKALFPFQSTFLVMDKDTVVLTMRRDLAEAALGRVTGKTKTRLKNKEVADFLRKLDPEAALQMLALGSSVWGTSMSARVDGGEKTKTVKHTTLSDAGLVRIEGSVTVKEEIAGSATLRAKDKQTARERADQMQAGIAEATRELERLIGVDENFKPVLEAARGVKVQAKEAEIGLTFKGGPKTVEGLFRLIFFAGAGAEAGAGAAPPPPRVIGKDK